MTDADRPDGTPPDGATPLDATPLDAYASPADGHGPATGRADPHDAPGVPLADQG